MKTKSFLIKIILILSFLLFSLNTYAWEEVDYYLYYGDTSEYTTVAWADPRVTTPENPMDDYNPATDSFEISIFNKERDINVVVATNIPGDIFEHTFRLPKTGHWIPKIRAVRYAVVDGVEENTVTDWSESINPEVAVVNGVSRSWWLFAWIAPVGPIIP